MYARAKGSKKSIPAPLSCGVALPELSTSAAFSPPSKAVSAKAKVSLLGAFTSLALACAVALPVDAVCAEALEAGAASTTVAVDAVPARAMMLDVGPATVADLVARLGGLRTLLCEAGFKRIRRYDWRETEFADIDDFSKAYWPHLDFEKGLLMSLNVECTKHLHPPDHA